MGRVHSESASNEREWSYRERNIPYTALWGKFWAWRSTPPQCQLERWIDEQDTAERRFCDQTQRIKAHTDVGLASIHQHVQAQNLLPVPDHFF